jgi:class 3 adenylate cyclase
MDRDFENLTLTELVRLQSELSQSLTRRFERRLALTFSDIVGSTAYFARFGDEAGRQLQQRHLDLLHKVLPKHQGRLVDTAGDGAFCCFPTAAQAAEAMVELQTGISFDNASRARHQQLIVQIGIHHGRVLTDGNAVVGDGVNFCARVAASGGCAEIRVSRDTFFELPPILRLSCRKLAPLELKGIAGAIELLVLDWRDRALFPTSAKVAETGETIHLPDQDILTCGRLKESAGIPANDIVLSLSDPQLTMHISRWHFELRRQPDGLFLRQVSDGMTEVNGVRVPKGEQVPVRSGFTVAVARVMTLEFIAAPAPVSAPSDTTLITTDS